MTHLATAKTACTDGKGFADKFADFLVKRAEANLVLNAAQVSGWTIPPATSGMLASADTKAAPATRNYVGAKADCDALITGLAPSFKKFYVDNVKPKIAALKAMPAAAFIKAETDELDKLMLQQEAHIAAKQWRQVRLNVRVVNGKILAAKKAADRRASFDTERPKVDAALKALAPHGVAIAAPLAVLQQRVKQADDDASKKGMQFEDAKTALAAVVEDCKTLGSQASAAVKYSQERGALAAELSKLRGHAAADKIKAELDVARGLLDAAAKAALDKGAPGIALALGADPKLHDFATAAARLAQARTTLATARSLAEGLSGVAALEDQVKDKSNLTELRKGYDTLATALAEARKQPGADLAAVPFGHVQTALDEAKAKLDAKKAEGVAALLTGGGAQLTAGRRIQIEHRQFLDRFALLKGRLDKHNADKAQAAKLEIKLKELAKALKDAEAAEAKPDHAAAIAALNTAEAAAAAADGALVRRVEFDKAANLLRLDLEKPANASLKAAQSAEITRARAFAFVLDFASADKTLAGVRHAIAKLETEKMATATPPDPKLADKAKALADGGGTKELDALIKSLPATVDKAVFVKLAEARFKCTFDVDDAAGAQDSIKRMCELMKDIPDDVIGNPSLKKITRRGAEATPYYTSESDEVVMNSRPKAGNKADFPSAAGRLPEREEACKPKNNDPEDLFDFNMLHEVAHAIDDARSYMAKNGHLDSHGGWIQIGGNVDQIADAVLKQTGFGKEPEARQYVLDRILRNPAVPPSSPFAGDKARFEKFVTAAQTSGVWSSQSLSQDATLDGRVYQESYAHNWTSYKADARKRGITGYQFRAPGEWFSELYAAWKRGKLKDEHPAVGWLKTLKI